MSELMHVVLLLDLAADNPIDEAMVRAQLPEGAAPPLVFRLTDFIPARIATGTPDNWLPVMSAIDRMLRAARGPEHGGRCFYWVAGRAGLPAFFYLGYRLSKKAAVTLVNPRDAGQPDVLQLDAPNGAAPPHRYFSCSPWPGKPSHSQGGVGLIVSSRIRIAPEQVEEVMSQRDDPPAVIVEAQAGGVLDSAYVGTAIQELDEQVVGIRTWYPRSSALSVFLAGPATLAFLVGRAINPSFFPDVRVFQYRGGTYQLAHDLGVRQMTDISGSPRRRPDGLEFLCETRSRSKKHIIMFLASNPMSTSRLAVEDEAHDIQRELQGSEHRDRFEFKPQPALRRLEFRRQLKALAPSVVHFSGHGDATGLVFHHDDGGADLVTPQDLGDIFRLAHVAVKLVVLNACFSVTLAEALLQHVDCIVGMPGAVFDGAAKAFAIAFYGALGDRESVQDAVDLGRHAMRSLRQSPLGAMSGPGLRDVEVAGLANPDSDEGCLPNLLVRPGVDPGALILASMP